MAFESAIRKCFETYDYKTISAVDRKGTVVCELINHDMNYSVLTDASSHTYDMLKDAVNEFMKKSMDRCVYIFDFRSTHVGQYTLYKKHNDEKAKFHCNEECAWRGCDVKSMFPIPHQLSSVLRMTKLLCEGCISEEIKILCELQKAAIESFPYK